MPSKKQKYSPVNGAPASQIELVDQGDQIQRGPSQFDTKSILDSVATPRSKGQITPRAVAPATKLPVQDRVWNHVNKAVFWVYLALALATIAMMIIGLCTGTVSEWIGMIAIIGITWIGSFLGMWATYLTGTFEVGFVSHSLWKWK